MTQSSLAPEKTKKGFSYKTGEHLDVASFIKSLKARNIEVHRTAQSRLESQDFRLHTSLSEVSLHFSSPKQLGFKDRPESLKAVRGKMERASRELACEQDVEFFAPYEASKGEQVFLITNSDKVFMLDFTSGENPVLYYLSIEAGCDHGCVYADRGIKSS